MPSTLPTLAGKSDGNVLKGMDGAVLVGHFPTASAVSTLIATGGQVTIPASYSPVGWISEDGLTFSKDRDLSQLRGWGGASFIRQDVKSENRTLQFSGLETNRTVLELKNSADYSAIQMSVAGEVALPIPDRPATKYWRVISLARDGEGDGLVYVGVTYDKAFVSDIGDEVWSDGDDPIIHDITLSAQLDSDTGLVGNEWLFGPGALARATEFGFTVASS